MSSSPEFSIAKVASLARLKVDNEQEAELTSDLNGVLKLIEVLDELELDEVIPFYGLNPIESDVDLSPKRIDKEQSSLSQKEALSNAPKADGEFYLVPPVFE